MNEGHFTPEVYLRKHLEPKNTPENPREDSRIPLFDDDVSFLADSFESGGGEIEHSFGDTRVRIKYRALGRDETDTIRLDMALAMT